MQTILYNITIITRLHIHTDAGGVPCRDELVGGWVVGITECCYIYIYWYMRTTAVLCSIYSLSIYYMYNNMTII